MTTTYSTIGCPPLLGALVVATIGVAATVAACGVSAKGGPAGQVSGAVLRTATTCGQGPCWDSIKAMIETPPLAPRTGHVTKLDGGVPISTSTIPPVAAKFGDGISRLYCALVPNGTVSEIGTWNDNSIVEYTPGDGSHLWDQMDGAPRGIFVDVPEKDQCSTAEVVAIPTSHIQF